MLSEKYHFDDFELLSGEEQTTKSFVFNKLYDLLINSLEEDSILIVYSGHGEYNPIIGTSYWLTSDAKKNDATTWLNVGDILDVFKVSKAKHIALISDSCFSGAIFESETKGGGIKALEEKYSRQALTSGSIEPVSDGKAGESSPFTISVLQTLEDNAEDNFTFSSFSEEVIKNFSATRSQTPMHGALTRSGHKGGSYIYKLRKGEIELFRDLKLNLGIRAAVKMKSDISIPFINNSSKFNNEFINSFIQQQGYAIINEARLFFQADEDFHSDHEYLLEVGYTVEMFTDKFLSIVLSRFDYFGGAHPNNYMYTLNFAFNPDRKISLDDLIDYSEYKGFEDFLSVSIDKYADEEAKEYLHQYKESINIYDNPDFSFNEKTLTIYFSNVMPRMIMALGYLEIPMESLKFKL